MSNPLVLILFVGLPLLVAAIGLATGEIYWGGRWVSRDQSEMMFEVAIGTYIAIAAFTAVSAILFALG